jgi:ATP-dependent 26S proteasome regulatory subunit
MGENGKLFVALIGSTFLPFMYSRTKLPYFSSVVRLLREELQLLQEPGSYVGEVVKLMGKKKVLVKVRP